MRFGLMFFAASLDALEGERYRLVVESARFADAAGFDSVWVPERHFTRFGGLYPNPAVLHAALAMVTSRVHLRAGSVVMPLHDPLRVAEEWAMVDNLSGGRVGLSFASGWNPDDFAFFPGRYAERHEEMYAGIEAVRALWRGQPRGVRNGTGQDVQVRVYPPPVQPELPLWITAAGNPETFARAGRLGAHLLTHILDQDADELESKIALYRAARAEAGHAPETGRVSLMLHTLLGDDAARVREQARRPFCEYIKSNFSLLKGLARSRGFETDLSQVSERERDEFVGFLYERFADSRGLIGTPESTAPLVADLAARGVDELACLLDFGPPTDIVLSSLPHLARLVAACAHVAPAPRPTPPASLRPAPALRAGFDPLAVQARAVETLDGAQLEARLSAHGVEVPLAHVLRRVWRAPGEALGELRLRDAESAALNAYALAPGLLDACSLVFSAALHDTPGELYLPAGVRRVVRHAPLEPEVWSHAALDRAGGAAGARQVSGDVRVYAPGGRLLVEIEGLSLRRVGAPAAPEVGFYALAWRRADAPAARPHASGTWLVLADAAGVGTRVAAALEAAGQRCQVVPSPAAGGTLDPQRPEAWRALVAGAGRLHGVVDLWPLDTPDLDRPEDDTPDAPERAARVGCAAALHLGQALLAAGQVPQVWLVTRGAQPLAPGDACPGLSQAPLWGLGRVLALEQPELRPGLLDLDPRADLDRQARDVVATLLGGGDERLVGFRDGERAVARLTRLEAPAAAAPAFAPDGAYLVTGGLGGLGLLLARWLCEHGARHVTLAGRGAPSPEAEETLLRLRRDGLTIAPAQADVSRAEDVAALLRPFGREQPALHGVFHLAGVLDDGLLPAQDWPRFERALAAKVAGAWHLDRLTRDQPLDHFVLFSSAAALVALPGQSSYAAANVFLDALAHRRRALGRPALSVDWGPWAAAGHAATRYGAQAHARLAQAGVGALQPAEGFDALARLLACGLTQAGVVRFDWARFRAQGMGREVPLLAELREAAPESEAAPDAGLLRARLAGLPAAERQRALVAELGEILAAVLRFPSGAHVGPRQPFFELGLDSILALELNRRLEAALGCRVGPVVLFKYPTLAGLAEHLLATELAAPDAPAAGPAPEAVPAAADEAALRGLSDEQLARLLADEIEGRR